MFGSGKNSKFAVAALAPMVVVVAALFILPVLFSGCGSPLGFGKPIDWEPPVLTMDPIRNPLYVRNGAQLGGTVADNVDVSRVVMLDSKGDPKDPESELFRAELHPTGIKDDQGRLVYRWEITLEFEEKDNGKKISALIVGYDTTERSGDESMAAVTLIVDTGPPVVDDIWIDRTDMKRGYLERWHELRDLERTDPRGERSANVDRYQNGYFSIKAKLTEKETRLKAVALHIYDASEPNTLLIDQPIGEGSPFTPSWLIAEKAILAAGNSKIRLNYESDYYNGQRYYYRVAILAEDQSGNENGVEAGEDFEEEQGFFCMWERADAPKGVLDPLAVGVEKEGGFVVSRGTPLPLEFFDDDTLGKAYTGLLTKDQWEGIGDYGVAPGVFIPSSYTNEEKLEWLKNRLTSSDDNIVYNWRYGKTGATGDGDKSYAIKELIGGDSLYEKWEYVETGNNENDYGEFVLFSLVEDKKLPPHPVPAPVGPPEPPETYKPRWTLRAYKIEVIDENAPLIVFDTTVPGDTGYQSDAKAPTGGSPEENTFPKLTGGQFFEINGYTLRENKSGQNGVRKFRVAWIPYGIGGGKPDDYIKAVQNALKYEGEHLKSDLFSGLPGVQYWEFIPETILAPSDDNPAPEIQVPGEGQKSLVNGTDEEIGAGGNFRKQVFRKTFDILGGNDDLKPSSYNNFKYNYSDDKPENETKLFVFYAEDNMGHQVFRQLRLLGNKTPPDLIIYDISGDITTAAMPAGIPNVNTEYGGEPTPAYDNALKNYNKQTGVYDLLRDKARSLELETYQDQGQDKTRLDDRKTIPWQTYTRESVIKYWVTAAKSGDLAVANITMKDITSSDAGKDVGSDYNGTDGALTFCEYYPDEAQRVFLFEAEDVLGNIARIQRTIAITNAAKLESITTIEQSGSYGIDKDIVLRANFSAQVRIEANGTVPHLNVRYQTTTSGTGHVYQSLPCTTPANTSTLYLEFTFKVPENAKGELQTMYEGLDLDRTGEDARPIKLNNSRIMDNLRDNPAFVPGYTTESATMPNWTQPNGSLQIGKDIMLDGERPQITGFTLATPAGKTYYTDANAGYYYKADETIEFTLTSDKEIFTGSAAPVIQFRVASDGTWRSAAWSKSLNASSMSFSVLVNSPISDGQISAVRLSDASSIVDSVGNAFVAGNAPYTHALISSTPPSGANTAAIIRIDKTPPTAPTAALSPGGGILENGGTAPGIGANPTQMIYYNRGQTLTVSGNGGESAPVTSQYSLDGGVSWTTGTTGSIPNGQRTLMARLTDRAGNVGVAVSQDIHVNQVFPNLIAVNIDQPSGWYKIGASLSFTLDFAEAVRVSTPANVQIVLTNRGSTFNQNGTGNNNHILSADTGQTSIDRTGYTTLKFTWTGISDKEMRDGMYISHINLSGLTDRFGNTGPTAANITYNASTTAPSPIGGTFASPAINNLGTGVKVDAIAPTSTKVPANTAVSANNTTITLTFSEPVMRGNGLITVKPRGNYAIPPVFEDQGYYLGTDGTRYNAPGANRTYITSFYDLYNDPLLDATDRGYLTQGSSMSNLALKTRTGQSAGPYVKTTHGLIAGPGYTGDYSGTYDGTGPNPTGTFMIPDTATKWVLDYQYTIADTTANSAVSRIRGVLNKAKFRWQEIDVVSTALSNGTNGNNSVVTINLNEPLLKGLQWDVVIPAGAFTDEAGNAAAVESDYWFWSSGVQAPVIRVNRRSYDARDSNWASNTNRTFQPPAPTATWTAATAVTDDNGWGIGNFNTVHYRVESESPGATVSVGTREGGSSTNNYRGSVTASWVNENVQVANPNNTSINNVAWNAEASNTAGQWVLSNFIRRSRTSGTVSYTVTTKNGTPEARTSQGTYRGFRSYNRDLNETELNSITLAAQSSGYQGVITFNALEGSKSYVAAQATVNGSSAKGYEGVFRTIIVLKFSDNTFTISGNNRAGFILVEGSNVKNGMPSIAGFPVRDAEETGDNRFVKAFYRMGDTGAVAQQYYWVSTEIVCEWYFLKWGGSNTNTHQNVGEVNNYLTVGYGDLTFGYNITSY